MAAEAKPTKRRCFFIAPIGDEDTPIRLHSDMVLNSIVRIALPDFYVQRADEFGKPEMITDKVIEAIFTYELAVADLTDNNPNVLYELGLRHMQELPVIHIAQVGNKRVFDVGGMNALPFNVHDWNSHVTVRQQIAAAAKEVMVKDYKVSNPVTASRASTKLAKSTDTRDQMIAQTMAKQAELDQRLRSVESKEAARELTARLWASPTFPPQVGIMQPDTGQPFASTLGSTNRMFELNKLASPPASLVFAKPQEPEDKK